jgi:hypothetical protein
MTDILSAEHFSKQLVESKPCSADYLAGVNRTYEEMIGLIGIMNSAWSVERRTAWLDRRIEEAKAHAGDHHLYFIVEMQVVHSPQYVKKIWLSELPAGEYEFLRYDSSGECPIVRFC